MLNNKSILITGGTGSFGKVFLDHCLKRYKKIKKIIIFSRDELKQFELREKYFRQKKYINKIRFFLGDVRDLHRLRTAFEDVDYVVHAAALKQVESSEYNPLEVIKTNIIGAQNVIDSAIYNRVKKVVALSTDKASSPINLYGASKLCSDKLFLSSNNTKGSKDISFSIVRYGNVLGSRGSVLPEFIKQNKRKEFKITDDRMTRFNILLNDGVKFVDDVLHKAVGGEIFVPKMSSFKILDLAKSISKTNKISIVGIRPGEKIHEEVISNQDSRSTFDFKRYFVILSDNKALEKFYEKKFKAKKVNSNFVYSSNLNKKWLTINDLKKMLKKNKFILK
tara:strand:+ start:77 stop:1084 length:1008 start_codon:yes stop_codon:yes gene_type:complete